MFIPTTRTLFAHGILAVFLLAGGCTRSPERSYYSLQGPAARPTRAEAVTPSRMDVVLGPVTLPDSLDRRQIVTRSGANQLEINDLHRWAQPLPGEIAAVLAADLYRDLGRTTLVGVHGQETATGDPAYRVAVDIERFESVLGDSATVEAAWIVRRKPPREPLRGRTLAREPVHGPGFDALAPAYARALGHVSRDIAAAILAR